MEETPEEKELHLNNNRERAYTKRLQEPPEEKEVCVKKSKANRLQETQRKSKFISKAQKKREMRLHKKSLNQKD